VKVFIVPAVAAVGSNAVPPSAELAADLETRVKAQFVGEVSPSGSPLGVAARVRTKGVIEALSIGFKGII
jgi:hypothetical protein